MGEVFEVLKLYPPPMTWTIRSFGVFWCTDKWTPPPASEPYHRPCNFFKKMIPSPSLLWMAPCTAYPPALMEISTTPSLTMGWMLMLRYYVQFLPCFFLPTKCNLEYQISECLCNLIPRPAVKTCGATQNFIQEMLCFKLSDWGIRPVLVSFDISQLPGPTTFAQDWLSFLKDL